MPRQHPRQFHQKLWRWDPVISILKAPQVIPEWSRIENHWASAPFPLCTRRPGVTVSNTVWTPSSGSWCYPPLSFKLPPPTKDASHLLGVTKPLRTEYWPLWFSSRHNLRNWREMNINITKAESALEFLSLDIKLINSGGKSQLYNRNIKEQTLSMPFKVVHDLFSKGAYFMQDNISIKKLQCGTFIFMSSNMLQRLKTQKLPANWKHHL